MSEFDDPYQGVKLHDSVLYEKIVAFSSVFLYDRMSIKERAQLESFIMEIANDAIQVYY
jgi:hypothetical protein